MADWSLTGLRVLREVAERGSFTAAARSLGYTQSAVSRQIAALEADVGRPLFARGRGGVTLTPAGTRLVALAGTVLADIESARRDLDGAQPVLGPVRLGAFASANAALVPRALAAVRREHPDLEVTIRESTTPALVRALRAGTVDLAVLAGSPPFRPYDQEDPPLHVETLAESNLTIAVGTTHRFAGRSTVDIAELEHERWVVGRADGPEGLLGVWPGLPGRPDIAYVARDWLSRSAFVAAGLAITSWPRIAASAVPAGCQLVEVRGGSSERRRTAIARLPGPPSEAITVIEEALRAAVAPA
jgi:DNA-binding transcriptional LysR family regulator